MTTPQSTQYKNIFSRRLSQLTNFTRMIAAMLMIIIMLCGLGFFWFADHITSFKQQTIEPADGIVVLTGGAARIDEALYLLSQGMGKRLLISGVNRETTTEILKANHAEFSQYFACCVDIDYEALNTLGNAVETRKWVERNAFRDLIIVTSLYHLPRSMLEYQRLLPRHNLKPYGVDRGETYSGQWWRNPQTTKRFAREYIKFLLAQISVRLSPAIIEEANASNET